MIVFDYPRHICERIFRQNGCRHVWDYPALKKYLTEAGFDRERVSHIFSLTITPPSREFMGRFPFRQLRRLALGFQRENWLIAKAVK